MSIKLITRVMKSSDMGINQCWAKICLDTDIQEYRVKFYRHTEYLPASDYFTGDLQDAKQTAETQCMKGY